MVAVLTQYLDSVRDNLRLDLASEREVINELQTHIEDEFEEMREAGLSEEEAASTCLRLLGSAKQLARQIYEAHSQGTWRQALLASMPHLLFALVFALNWWYGIGWLIITLSLILSTAIYGWCRGRPIWLFPWLGYSLLPVVMAGLLLLYLPKGWAWLTILLYVPLVLWLVASVTIQTIRRDWLYSALMLLPVPIIVGWFLVVEKEGRFLEFSLEHIHQFAPWIGLSFLALAITAVAFVRLRQRWLRIALLFISGLLTLSMVAFYAEGRLGLPAFLILTVIMLGLLLSPALVEWGIRYGKRRLRAYGGL
ncbi:permease prefix domain 1-containing protein [Chloroflexota bacterium]